jgi:hypothetical protein
MDNSLAIGQIEKIISEIDHQFRFNFQDLIKETKLFTHKCQFLCYKDKTSLKESEECARNCFKPMLYIKKHVAGLVEKQKEEFEKCKFTAENQYKESSAKNKALTKCIEDYSKELLKMKGEVEYIYKGYAKNFNELIGENDQLKI